MEEMKNQIMDGTMNEVVEEAADKLSFKENLAAYGLATVFGIGVATTGYLGYKGVKTIIRKIKSKKEKEVEENDEEIVDDSENEIHESKNNETEE